MTILLLLKNFGLLGLAIVLAGFGANSADDSDKKILFSLAAISLVLWLLLLSYLGVEF